MYNWVYWPLQMFSHRYWVCNMHPESDWNLNMFPDPVFITTFEMCHLSLHHKYDFKNAEPFEIDKDVVAITTSSPSGGNVSVIVKRYHPGNSCHCRRNVPLWRRHRRWWTLKGQELGPQTSEDPLRPHPYHGWLYHPCRFRIPHLKWKYHYHFLVLFVLCM